MSSPSVANKKRIIFAFWFIIALFLLLIGRLVYIQVIAAEDIKLKGEQQWTRDTALSAARGEIIDSTGVVLAKSGTAYKIVAWPKEMQNITEPERNRIATELSKLLGLDFTSVYTKIGLDRQEVVIARQLEREIIDEVYALKLGVGIGVATDTKRYYPSGSVLSQVLGFTTIDGVGQSGIELRYDKYLAGENGRLVADKDGRGRQLAYGLQEIVEPTDGCSIWLTGDIVYQTSLEKACREAMEVNNAISAQGILMDCNTGEILAITTMPDYDPNKPPRQNAQTLAALTRNRIVADSYEPGSTFKLVTLAAAIDSGAIDINNFSCTCGGSHIVNGERIRCWRSTGHGTQDIYKSAQNSCNPAFMKMALSMGTETFYDYIYGFGFGSSTGSNLTGEASGIVTYEKYIRENTLARIGFGQSIAVTPIQLVTAVSAAINGGMLMQPYIVDKIVSADGTVLVDNEPTIVRRVIKESTSATVRSIAETVVSEGSGKNAAIAGYKVGGKTGTAQKYEDGKIADGKLIASFIGFAPADAPRYVCLILVDEPKVGTIFGSTVAAPFVKQVLEEALHHGGYLWDGQKSVAVPNLIGLTIAEASKKLEEHGLVSVYEASEDATVSAQVPMLGQETVTGAGVLLYADYMPEETETASVEYVTVPNLIGKNRLKTYDALKAVGLVLKTAKYEVVGTAIRQYPAAGEKVEVGTEILVDFSSTEIGGND